MEKVPEAYLHMGVTTTSPRRDSLLDLHAGCRFSCPQPEAGRIRRGMLMPGGRQVPALLQPAFVGLVSGEGVSQLIGKEWGSPARHSMSRRWLRQYMPDGY